MDDECETCGHYRANHGPGACLGCTGDTGFHPFAPAEPEAQAVCGACGDAEHGDAPCGAKNCLCGHPVPAPAPPGRLDPDCIRPTGCRDRLKRGCAHGCAEAADELTRLDEEMEAPECAHDSWEERSPSADFRGEVKISRWCNDCGDYLGRFSPTLPIEEVAEPIGPASIRRPPYAVAYALASGAQYEIALPGDATIRFADGALIITHASPVKGLTQARPMEGT